MRGTLDGSSKGFRDGERLNIDMFNAQGDLPTGIAIARQITTGDYDLVITSSTPSMQAVANNNREGKVRHVFTLVADPFVSGVGLDRADPRSIHLTCWGKESFRQLTRRSSWRGGCYRRSSGLALPGIRRKQTPWRS